MYNDPRGRWKTGRRINVPVPRPVQLMIKMSRHKAVEDQKSSEGTKFPHGATLLWQDVQMTACSWLVTYRK